MVFTNYTNEVVYNYLQKEVSSSSKYADKYQILIEDLEKSGLSNQINKKKLSILKQFIINRIITEYPDFNIILNKANNYLRAIKNDDGSYSVYPSVNFPTYTDMIIDYCLTNGIDLESAIEYYNQLLTTVVIKKKEELNNSVINEYRGDLAYMITRARAVYDACKAMTLRTDLTDEEISLANQSLIKIANCLNGMLNIVDSTLTIDNIDISGLTALSPLHNCKLEIEEYDAVNNLYDDILAEEDNLMNISKKIWSNFSKDNGSCLVHKLTGSIIPSDDMFKICTAYYSDNIKNLPTYQGNTGYVYPIDLDFILSLCTSDAGSWFCDKKEFIDRGLPNTWQLTSSNIFYENPYQSKLFSPEFMEQTLMNQESFAEIVINNNQKKIRPLYCFYTEGAAEEEIALITKIASEQGLEVQLLEKEKKKKIVS